MQEDNSLHDKNIDRLLEYFMKFPNMFNVRVSYQGRFKELKGRYHDLSFTIVQRAQKGLSLHLHWGGKQYFNIPVKIVQDEDINVLGGFIVDKLQINWIRYGG